MYQYKQRGTGKWSFVTDNNFEFRLSLSYPDDLVQVNQKLIKFAILEFSFYNNDNSVGNTNIQDQKISLTIIGFLEHFLNSNPDFIIIYTCLTETRFRLFQIWQSKYSNSHELTYVQSTFRKLVILRRIDFKYMDDLNELIQVIQAK